MSCMNVKYEKQFITSSVVWFNRLVFNKNVFDWQYLARYADPGGVCCQVTVFNGL